jgi:hypothetical protein
MEQVQHDGEVAAIESRVPTLECLDVRLAHPSEYIRLVIE